MKAIMISGKPKWTAKIANGDKSTEVRTSKSLYKAIQKLIDEYGYADIYWYCTKDKKIFLRDFRDKKKWAAYWRFVAMENDPSNVGELPPILNGKVIFKFRCYKMEEILPFEEYESPFGMAYKLTKDKIVCCQKAQLTYDEYNHYLKGKKGCAIHISDLEIFDKPKELSELKSYKKNIVNTKINGMVFETELDNSLIKAPQNYCYIEI